MAGGNWQARRVTTRADVLGEGPYWCAHSRRLWWFDIMKADFCCYDPLSGAVSVVRTARKLHAMARAAWPWFLVTAHGGLAWLNAETAELRLLRDPEEGRAGLLLNDGRCDEEGAFWFASIHKKGEPEGSLWRLDGDGSLTRHHGGLATGNGLAFSPDGRWLYLVDTYVGLLRFPLEGEGERLGPPRLLLDARLLQGWPDGLTLDSEGCLWLALAHGGAVLRLTPEGKVDATLGIPARFVTSCTFGDEDLGTLYVTTATAGRSPEELAAYPQSGALFAVRTGYRGLPEMPYAGRLGAA